MQRLHDFAAVPRLVASEGLSDRALRVLNFLFADHPELLPDALALVDAALPPGNRPPTQQQLDNQHQQHGASMPPASGSSGSGGLSGEGSFVSGSAAVALQSSGDLGTWSQQDTGGGRGVLPLSAGPASGHRLSSSALSPSAHRGRIVRIVFRPSGRVLFQVQGRSQRCVWNRVVERKVEACGLLTAAGFHSAW
jgi:hypothetical protein